MQPPQSWVFRIRFRPGEGVVHFHESGWWTGGTEYRIPLAELPSLDTLRADLARGLERTWPGLDTTPLTCEQPQEFAYELRSVHRLGYSVEATDGTTTVRAEIARDGAERFVELRRPVRDLLRPFFLFLAFLAE